MKRLSAASILAFLLIALTAQAALGAETSSKRLNLNLKQVPFPEVIRQIFSGSDYSYSVDPALNDLRVSATLKNVTRDQAIRVVTKTAGVVYAMENNAYTFRPDPQTVGVRSASDRPPYSAPPKGPAKIDVITLRYVSSGDAAALLSASPPDGLLSVTATSVNTLMIKGDASAIDQVKNVVKLFDVEAALPRAVHLTLNVEITATGLAKPITLSTESVGTEGNPVPLDINSSQTANSMMVSAKLTPNVLPDGSISVTGNGAVDCTVASQRISKAFEAAASATAGVKTVIASGSTDSGAEKMDFVASVTVTVDKGRIVLPRGQSPAPTLRPTTMSPPANAAAAPSDDIHRQAADAILQQIWDAEPGKATFDAIDAVAGKYRQADLATQNAIASACVAYMKDTSRDLPKRWPCCYVISRCGYKAGTSELIGLLQNDGSEIIRAVAAEALGGISSEAAARDALVQAAHVETSTRVREVLAKYLGKDMMNQ